MRAVTRWTLWPTATPSASAPGWRGLASRIIATISSTASSIARRALVAATSSGNDELVHLSQLELFEALASDRTDEAWSLADTCLPWIDDIDDGTAQMGFHSQLAMLYDRIGRLSSGQRRHLLAMASGERHNDLENQAILINNYANNRARTGQLRLAVAMRRQSAALGAQVEVMQRHEGVGNVNLANWLAALGEYSEALVLRDQAEEKLALTVPSGVALVLVCRATCWLHLGQRARAQQELRRIDWSAMAAHRPHPPSPARVRNIAPAGALRCALSRRRPGADQGCRAAAPALGDPDRAGHPVAAW